MEIAIVQDINISIKKKEFLNSSDNKKNHVAIKDFNLKILKRQFCSIIGPSGSGKTTLLNLIAGLDKDFDGNINFGTNDTNNHLRKAYMFQTPRLLPWLNVLQNVEIVLNKDQKKKEISKKFLSIMGLEKFLDYYPNKLSGGMQRRVALARSFATNPHLLILDEPFTSLDEPAANLLRKMLLELWTKHPTTVIFVTHDINEAIYLSDKIVFLSKPPASIIKEINIKTKRPREINNSTIQKIKNKILNENRTILKGEV